MLQSAEYGDGTWAVETPYCLDGFNKARTKIDEAHPVYKKGVLTVAFGCDSYSTTLYYALYHGNSVSWRPPEHCPFSERICGLQTQVDTGLNGHPVGMIEVQLKCCPDNLLEVEDLVRFSFLYSRLILSLPHRTGECPTQCRSWCFPPTCRRGSEA